jgi:hypothetical protein
MAPRARPHYDVATSTHYLEVGRVAFDALKGGLGLLSLSLFAEAPMPGNWIWLECEDEELLFRIGDLAAVLTIAEQP